MTDFKKCDRCGAVWSSSSSFGIIGAYRSGKAREIELCPSCYEQVLLFLNDRETYVEVRDWGEDE
jgi:DNA-directed RNA polymerase subunit M/transcription elongation factor TFIIS